MLKIFKSKKAQNTAEYAILIALVVGGVIAMQTYAQRALQARLRDASVHMRDETANIGCSLQYEPYYAKTDSTSTKNNIATTTQNGVSEYTGVTKTGTENTTYDNSSVSNSTITVPAGM